MSRTKARSTLKESLKEVTPKGINAFDSKQKLIVSNHTLYGSFKKCIIGGVIAVQSITIFIGLYVSWIDSYVHLAYPLGGIALLALFTLLTSKVE